MRQPRSVKASQKHTQALAVNVRRANFYSSLHNKLFPNFFNGAVSMIPTLELTCKNTRIKYYWVLGFSSVLYCLLIAALFYLQNKLHVCIEAQPPQMSWHELAFLTLNAGDALHVTSYNQDIAASSGVFCPSECFRKGVSVCCAAMQFWPFSHPHLMNFYTLFLDGEKWSRALEISEFYQLFDGIHLFIF